MTNDQRPMTTMRVVVTGARGRLGSAIVEACSASHDVVALARGDLDIVDAAAVDATIDRIAPHVVVNAAAVGRRDEGGGRPADAFNIQWFCVEGPAPAGQRPGPTCSAHARA